MVLVSICTITGTDGLGSVLQKVGQYTSTDNTIPGTIYLFLDLPILLFCAVVSATLFAERVSGAVLQTV